MQLADIHLHLGKLQGDLMRVGLKQLETPVDILVAGPPCPPWSSIGSRKCNNDIRAQVFWRVLIWAFYLAHCGGLLAVVIENVVGTLHKQDSRVPYMHMFLSLCQQFLPQFAWRVDKLALRDYQRPQSRVRVFLRGVRKIVSSAVPSPLAPWGQAQLRDVLGKSAPIVRKLLTVDQQANLRSYEQAIRGRAARGLLVPSDLVVFALDRKIDGVYGHQICKNYVPTLTCNNRYLFVASVGDVIARTVDAKRQFFSFLTGAQRLSLQGFDTKLALDLDSACQLKSSGNAYPVPLMIAVLHPVIQALANFNLSSWPPADALAPSLSVDQQKQQEEFQKALKRRPQQVALKRKASVAAARKLMRRRILKVDA